MLTHNNMLVLIRARRAPELPNVGMECIEPRISYPQTYLWITPKEPHSS